MNIMLCGVSGLQNKENKTQIKNALTKLEGVNEVGVNMQTGTVEIKYNAPANPAEIKNCIENTGFKIIYE